jgi:molybdate transport system substrate-binding protein
VKRIVIVGTTLSLLLAACGDPDDADGADLVVSAAASLTDAFTDIGAAFEQENPRMTVTFNFGPSDGLATQINDGAPVDVFASASPTWMDVVENEGAGVAGRADFAKNRLAIIVPTANPAGIDGIADLAADGIRLVIAAEGVPAGDYAREVLANAGIADAAMANVVSNAEDVRTVVTAVTSGEADAGIVYVTDVTSAVADQVALIEIPDEVNVIATYPIAVVSGTEDADLAQRFVDHVLGPGQRTLAEYGFLPA